jgi:uncharacterized membrane protein YhdT
VPQTVALALCAVVGWAVCGAIVAVGRQLISLRATLLIHAILTPLVFAALTWAYFIRFPRASSLWTSLIMVGAVAGLDALVVAPLFEHSFAMFRSPLGTWVPLASILLVIYLVGRAASAPLSDS